MKHSYLAYGLAGAIMAGSLAAPQVQAEDSIYVPLFSYRTGPFAGSGIPIANGMSDYLTMLNERDGGIGGVKIVVEECETGYNTQKGVECYELVKPKNPVVLNPYSTGITLQVIPKASADRIPVLSMAYGLSAAAEGKTFPWIFNPPATYWDGASAIVKDIANREGGLENLKGKKIGYIFLDAGYGREPIPLMEQLSKDYGFTLTQYPVPATEMQNQSSQWLNVRRDRPDYMIMWGWGAMNPTAVKEATKIRYPMDRFYGVWWSGGNDDAAAGGMDAKGYRTLNFHGVGTDFPVISDIKKYVVDAGKSQVDPAKFADNLYNRGVYNSMLIAEAIRRAQQLTGKKVVNAEDVRAGFEALDIDAARIAEMGMTDFMAPLKLSCEDHNGHNDVYVVEWDGTTWQRATDWFSPMVDVVQPLLVAAAEEYVKTNAPWPERDVPCAGE
ncbi:ABC transporter substrate-binding protein [Polymorphum gilvum]|uniref:ABC branched amino acid transporter family, periplasmic substrate-binding subunit n=1 Tax=Polymorphum gilvum (strain LMG 25793 / CGMCC 1.9160 / SL003B-26A1) TaxID=991905 RepID=F2IWG6_POLGS|nr:ABC transporter substrate-binding protein [Polymorphum gilvum]ADZ69265.1 ABC branched amino acid transporter family, periplasmic substrate-binding subunit [Polymorphum gilvum SL003B-26A1]